MIPFLDLQRQLAPIESTLVHAVREVLASGQLILGDWVEAFEAAFSRTLGPDIHVIAVANGTDALELSLTALGIAPGARVACVANAGGYATSAIHSCGAHPQYLDIARSGWQLDPAELEAITQPLPSAIVVTHLYGQMAPVARVVAWARERGVPVIEDCAQAHGARSQATSVGCFGDLGCFSFYPTKNLGALGDGGAIVSKDSGLAARVRRLRQYGWGKKYEVIEKGGKNSRLDGIQAAILIERLKDLPTGNERRRQIAHAYAAGIQSRWISVPERRGDEDVVHLFVVFSRHRDELRNHLKRRGVETLVHYPIPDHRQPVITNVDVSLPMTEAHVAEVLSLPCYPGLMDSEVDHVIAACNDFKP